MELLRNLCQETNGNFHGWEDLNNCITSEVKAQKMLLQQDIQETTITNPTCMELGHWIYPGSVTREVVTQGSVTKGANTRGVVR